jgi:MYXO-CTERM domain-containing protein
MKILPPNIRLAAAFFLTAAALPLSALTAQETQPPAEEPAAEQPASETSTAQPEPEPKADPVTIDSPPAPEAQTAEVPVVRQAPARSGTRTTATRARTSVPVAAPTAPLAAPTATPEALPPLDVPPAAALPVEGVPPADVLPETPGGIDRATVPAEQSEGGSILPWVIGGLLLAAALAFFLLRRRRRDTTVDEQVYQDRRFEEATPLAAAPVAAPILAPAPVAEAAPVAAAAIETGRPWLNLEVEPVRAGVTGDEAVVEFALTVANDGPADARDVRISTWMFPADGTRPTEMERMLIEHPDEETSLPETTIEAGGRKRIESSVALPTSQVQSDSVLPIVVAEARYRLPDGSEGRTSASFAVGVPDGAELAHFATDNPSGLHEGVEARPLGEVERA